MPIRESPNCVTVGHICLSCALYHSKMCPYKNHLRSQVTQFQGDIRGKCIYYMSVVEASGERDMVKEAQIIKEAELNVSLYKKLYALNDKQRAKLFAYWEHIFPKPYAKDMVSDENESGQKGLMTKKIDKDNKTNNGKKKDKKS